MQTQTTLNQSEYDSGAESANQLMIRFSDGKLNPTDLRTTIFQQVENTDRLDGFADFLQGHIESLFEVCEVKNGS